MMKSWSFILAVLSVNLVLTNGEEQIQQVKAELRNQTNKTHEEEADEIGKILKNVEAVMDPTVDPCENFYQFVCGKFSNKSVSTFDYFYKEFKRRLIPKYEQEEPLESENKLTIIKHSRNLYKSCKKTRNDKSFHDFILRDLEAIGGWPALKGNSWEKSAFDWKRSVFKVGGQEEWKNYLLNIQIYRTDNMIYLKLDPIDYYHKGALEFAARLGGDNSIVKEELERVNEFSKNFTKIYSTYLNGDRNPINLTLQSLTDKYPNFPWTEHFKYIEPDIPLNATVVIYRSSVMENIFTLLNNTDKRMLANIAALNRVSDIDRHFRKYHRLDDCFETTLRALPMAASFLYYHEFIHETKTIEAKQFAEQISNKIRQHFIEMLGNADWISNKTYSIEKLEKLSYQFGYPPDQFKDNLLNLYYDKLQSNQTNFYDALLSISEFSNRYYADKNIIKYRHELQEYFREIVNFPEAKYHENSNNILVRLALLQRQFINPNNPMWMNFASFGSIISHEIGQSLDPNLIQSNANGELIPWSKNSTSYIEYQKIIRCLNEMYRDIVNVSRINKNNLRKLLTTHNDIADNLGFKAAHLAYKNSPVKGKSMTLNQKEYSPNQLFWIYSTNRFCTVTEPMSEGFEETLFNSRMLKNPNRFRILGSLSNIEGFSSDFNCPENSPMNHQPKCSIF